MHSDEKKVKCAYSRCQGKYKMKEEYNRHYNSHRSTSEEHKCLLCKKVFNKKKYLCEHKQVHTGTFHLSVKHVETDFVGAVAAKSIWTGNTKTRKV